MLLHVCRALPTLDKSDLFARSRQMSANDRLEGPGSQDDDVHSPSLLMFSSASRWVVRLALL